MHTLLSHEAENNQIIYIEKRLLQDIHALHERTYIHEMIHDELKWCNHVCIS